jgi:hypothetical protein
MLLIAEAGVAVVLTGGEVVAGEEVIGLAGEVEGSVTFRIDTIEGERAVGEVSTEEHPIGNTVAGMIVIKTARSVLRIANI